MVYQVITFIGLLLCVAWAVTSPGFDSITATIFGFAIYFRNEVHGIIGLKFISLTPKTPLIKNLQESKFSFFSPEYIHPKIIEDLGGLLSDTGDQVVAVNLLNSNSSNKYFGAVTTQVRDKFPIVICKEKDTEFSYQYIGGSFNGIHIVRTWNSGGGTGIFCTIALFIITADKTIDYENGSLVQRDRFLLKKIGALPLGDRYSGEIKYKFGFLYIPHCSYLATIRKSSALFFVL